MDLAPAWSPDLSLLGLRFPSVQQAGRTPPNVGPEDLLGPLLDVSLTLSVPRLILGMMVTTSFLSMWLSNTASTAMMLPIASAILKSLFGQETWKDLSQQGEENSGEAVQRHWGSPHQHARRGAECPKVAGDSDVNALTKHTLYAKCLNNNNNN